MHCLIMSIFFKELYAVTSGVQSVWLFPALSSCVCTEWSSCTGATPWLALQSDCCLHFPAACLLSDADLAGCMATLI